MTKRTFRVGDIVYHDPAKRPPKNQGIPKRIDLGTRAWVIIEILDHGRVRLQEEGSEEYVSASGTRVLPTTAVISLSALISAEEMVARKLMGAK